MSLFARCTSGIVLWFCLAVGACGPTPQVPASGSDAVTHVMNTPGGGSLAPVVSPVPIADAVAAGTGGAAAVGVTTTTPKPAPSATGAAGATRSSSAGSAVAGAGGSASTTWGPAGRSASATMTGGAGGVAAVGAPAAPVDLSKPPCETSPNDTVVIGDSYINWPSHNLPADLAALAGETWPLYAVGGASMATGGIAELIPDQFDDALAANPNLKFVVMDGGGNDVLIPDATIVGGGDCKNSDMAGSLPACQQIVKTSFDTASKLLGRMADAGVRDVLFFFYPHVPRGTLIGGDNPNAILDYALPMVKEVCTGTEQRTAGHLKCHFVDMVPVFEGHNPDWFAAGDIHPNPDGSAGMAKAIWDTMKKACMAQKSTSDCCAP